MNWHGILLLVPLVSAAAASPEPDVIQPGDEVVGPVTTCTLNFLFDGRRQEVYFGTAAHCVNLGDVVSTTGHPGFGTVAYDDDAFADFALVRVHTDVLPFVSPQVKNRPGAPKGFVSAVDTLPGDPLFFTGGSPAADQLRLTQERAGVLVAHTEERFCAEAVTMFGDSGGPVLHLMTDNALGIVSRPATECFSTLAGSTLVGALALTRHEGFAVKLRTV